jgi:hypothetical protein
MVGNTIIIILLGVVLGQLFILRSALLRRLDRLESRLGQAEPGPPPRG